MDIKLFNEMLNSKHFTNYKRLKRIYNHCFSEYLEILEKLYYVKLPIADFNGNSLVFIKNCCEPQQGAVKTLMQSRNRHFGIKAVENEIIATSAIESIDLDRNSVRNVLKGLAPKDEQETRILGFKKGLEFIADISNKITEENLYRLYMMSVGEFLPESDKLLPGEKYRHDTVYVVSNQIEHAGLSHNKIPGYMQSLMDFINQSDDINDLVKAAIIHFYVSFIHPYFDGNGRIARLLHLWFLIQKGYQSTLFIPFSSEIEKSRKKYYEAFTIIEENKNTSHKIDVTPFIMYFIDNVYRKIGKSGEEFHTFAAYDTEVKKGNVTKKETELWKFVISFYGTEEFSTKQLEKDYGNAAYATIRSFVLKFEALGLLNSVKYGTRTKYFVNN